MDGGGCGRGQREQDKRLRSDSKAEELLGNQETNISIFGEEVMRLQSSYFPLFLTNPLLLSQFFKKLRRWPFLKKGTSSGVSDGEINLHKADEQKMLTGPRMDSCLCGNLFACVLQFALDTH